jgi:hypothetical protein
VSILIAILTLLLFGLVVAVVSAPFRAAKALPAPTPAPAGQDADAGAAARAGGRDELEAAREAKYREIRDAELDFRTGKLSPEDYAAIDADLRAEAIAILNRIEAAGAAIGAESARAGEDAPQ